MKPRTASMRGRISNEGAVTMYDKADLNNFLECWPNKNVIIIVEVFDPGTSNQLKGYYWASIVPKFRQAYREILQERYTLNGTDRKLRELSPATHRETPKPGGGYKTEILEFEDLDNSQAIEYLEHIKLIGAEHLRVYIPDPRSFYQNGLATVDR